MFWLKGLFASISYVSKEVHGRNNERRVQSSWLYISRLFQKYVFVQSGGAKCEMCQDRSLALEYCRDCDYFIDQYCADCHLKIINFQGHDRRPVLCGMRICDLAPKISCQVSDHRDCAINSFCSCCQELICDKCHKNHNREGHVIVRLEEFCYLLDTLVGIKFTLARILANMVRAPESSDEFSALSAAECAIDTMIKNQKDFKISDIPMKIRKLCGIDNNLKNVSCKEGIEQLSAINARLKTMPMKRPKRENRCQHQNSVEEVGDTTHAIGFNTGVVKQRRIERTANDTENRMTDIVETNSSHWLWMNECGSFSSCDLFDNNPNGQYHQKTHEEEVKGLQSDREHMPISLDSFNNLHPV